MYTHLQYIAGNNDFHFHDIDAPTRRVSLDDRLFQEARRRAAIRDGLPVPATPDASIVRSVILNQHPGAKRRHLSMAPTIIDLCGSSEDDDPPGSTPRSRSGGPPTLMNKSRASNVKAARFLTRLDGKSREPPPSSRSVGRPTSNKSSQSSLRVVHFPEDNNTAGSPVLGANLTGSAGAKSGSGSSWRKSDGRADGISRAKPATLQHVNYSDQTSGSSKPSRGNVRAGKDDVPQHLESTTRARVSERHPDDRSPSHPENQKANVDTNAAILQGSQQRKRVRGSRAGSPEDLPPVKARRLEIRNDGSQLKSVSKRSSTSSTKVAESHSSTKLVARSSQKAANGQAIYRNVKASAPEVIDLVSDDNASSRSVLKAQKLVDQSRSDQRANREKQKSSSNSFSPSGIQRTGLPGAHNSSALPNTRAAELETSNNPKSRKKQHIIGSPNSIDQDGHVRSQSSAKSSTFPNKFSTPTQPSPDTIHNSEIPETPDSPKSGSVAEVPTVAAETVNESDKDALRSKSIEILSDQTRRRDQSSSDSPRPTFKPLLETPDVRQRHTSRDMVHPVGRYSNTMGSNPASMDRSIQRDLGQVESPEQLLYAGWAADSCTDSVAEMPPTLVRDLSHDQNTKADEDYPVPSFILDLGRRTFESSLSPGGLVPAGKPAAGDPETGNHINTTSHHLDRVPSASISTADAGKSPFSHISQIQSAEIIESSKDSIGRHEPRSLRESVSDKHTMLPVTRTSRHQLSGSSREPRTNLTPSAAGIVSGRFTDSTSFQTERVLGKYLEELRSDSEHWTRTYLKRARCSIEALATKTKHAAEDTPYCRDSPDEPYSFAKIKPLQSTGPQILGESRATAFFTVEKTPPDGVRAKSSKKKSFTVNVTFFNTVDTMPAYSHYVTVKKNFVVPNVTSLHCWPYFGDDFDMESAANLSEQYHLDRADRPRKLLRLLQAQKYEEYVESALQDLAITWGDVLQFLLDIKPPVGADPDAQKALRNREDFCREDFTRGDERSIRVLSTLEALRPSDSIRLGKAASLCENFQKMAKFSLWHVARRHLLDFIPTDLGSDSQERDFLELRTCRICLRFHCPYHGEIKEDVEYDDNASDGSGKVDSAIAVDIINPPKINHRTAVAFPRAHESTEADWSNSTRYKGLDRTDCRYWRDYTHRPDERLPFYPCDHPGVLCEDAACTCFEHKIPCEKTCGCSNDCPRKFQGCACAAEKLKKGQKLVCYDDDRCACFQTCRECDPDLCGSCGVYDVLDPVNRHEDELLVHKCRNASIQRAATKHTLLGDSAIHGFGLFAASYIAPHEFVGEYKGEIITKEEAERRGAVYEHQKLSYLFSLNRSQEIDSTYFGNKVRFINHAGGGKANLYPRIIMVNTVHRIGLYGERPIRPGEELFFDYGPMFPDEQLGGTGKKAKKSAPSAPRVRNANLVFDEFYDVDFVDQKDAGGNLRARKAATKRGRPPKATTENKSSAPPPPPPPRSRGGVEAGLGIKAARPTPQEAVPNDADDEDVEGADAAARLQKFYVCDDDDDDDDAGPLPSGMQIDDENDDGFEPGDDSDMYESEASGMSDPDESDGTDEPRARPVPARRGSNIARGRRK